VDSQGQLGPEIPAEEVKKGTYIKGGKKVNESGESVLNFEELVTVI